MLTMARYTIRKTLQGQVLEEKVELLPDEDPQVELAFLGKLYADKLSKNQKFIQYCKDEAEGRNQEEAKKAG